MFDPEAEAAIRAAVAVESSHLAFATPEDSSRLYDAYLRGYSLVRSGNAFPTVDILFMLGEIIAPETRQRSGTATLPDGTNAMHAMSAPYMLERLMQHSEFFLAAQDWEIDYWVEQLLTVRPLEEGNARTAFILYNWLRQSWLNPAPLPDFFGDRS